jgi:DNA helicase-2/ATP-dependent DNA helicase PcrA
MNKPNINEDIFEKIFNLINLNIENNKIEEKINFNNFNKILYFNYNNYTNNKINNRDKNKILIINNQLSQNTQSKNITEIVKENFKVYNLDNNKKLIEEKEIKFYLYKQYESLKNKKKISKKDFVEDIYKQIKLFKKNLIPIQFIEKIDFDDINEKYLFLNIFSNYEKWKTKNHYLDFEDLISEEVNKITKLLIKLNKNKLTNSDKEIIEIIQNEFLNKYNEIIIENFSSYSKIEKIFLMWFILFLIKIEDFEHFNKTIDKDKNNKDKENKKILKEITFSEEIINLYYNLNKNEEFNKKTEEINNELNHILIENFIKSFLNKKDTNQNDIIKINEDLNKLLSIIKSTEFKYIKTKKQKIPYLTKKTFLEKTNLINNQILEKINNLTEIDQNKIGNIIGIKTENYKEQILYIIEELNKNNEKESIGIFVNVKETYEYLKELFQYFNIKYNLIFTADKSKENINLLISILKVINEPYTADLEIFKILEELNFENEIIKTLTRQSSLSEKSLYKYLLNNEKYVENELENKKIKQLIQKIIFLEKYWKTNKSYINLIKQILNLNLINIHNYDKEIKIILREIEIFEKKEHKKKLYNLIEYLEFLKRVDIEKEIYNSNNHNRNIDVIFYEKSINYNKNYDKIYLLDFFYKSIPKKYKPINYKNKLNQNYSEFMKYEEFKFYKVLEKTINEITIIYPIKDDNQIKNLESIYSEKLDLLFEQYKNKNNLDELIFDKINNEIIKEINLLISNKNFDSAKELIEGLINSQETNNLNNFINPNSIHIKKKYEHIFNKINKKDITEINFDFSNHTYSVSQINTYLQCPKKYLYQYIYKIPTKPKHYFDFGTTIHAVLENIIDDIKEDSELDLIYSKAVKLLNEIWISKGYENEEQEKEYFEKGLITIKNFIIAQQKLLKLNKNRKTIEKEKDFLIKLNNKKIYGIIDRIDKIDENNYEVLDYKTSNTMEKLENLQNNIQLFVYALALKELYGKYPKKIGLWYVIHNKIKLISFNEKNLEKLKNDILKAINEIETANFKPKPSKFNCTYCDFSEICKNAYKEDKN